MSQHRDIDANRPILPSLLSRLVEGDEAADGVSSYQVLEQYRRALRRDLEDLLNTRACVLPWPERLDPELVPRSCLNYGIGDLSGKHLLGQESQGTFLQEMKEAIKRYEPRLLKNVDVSPGAEPDLVNSSIDFRIEGFLRAEPAPEAVAYDSRLQAETRNVSIKGS